MTRRRLLLVALFGAFALHGEDTWSKVDRIVAIGDVHGDYDEFVTILRWAGLVNRENEWTGGKTHLVQNGDVLDRGADSRKVMDLLMDLEQQARKAGGYVHALIGNHEAMNLYGDLRYVSPGEYASYRTETSERVRNLYFEQYLKELKANPPAGGIPEIDERYRRQWDATHPLGYYEQRMAFSPSGKYGKWIRGHNAIIRINDIVFVHGGIGPKYSGMSIRQINEQIAHELEDFSKLEGGMAMDPEGPLWSRGLAQDDEKDAEPVLDAALKKWAAKKLVIAHTPTKGMITPRFGTRVLMIDVGLSKAYGSRPACLLVEDGRYFSIHRGTRVPLPTDMGTELMRYMAEITNLDRGAR